MTKFIATAIIALQGAGIVHADKCKEYQTKRGTGDADLVTQKTNIIDWRYLTNFNKTCLDCVLGLDATKTALKTNKEIPLATVKTVFEACDADTADWPTAITDVPASAGALNAAPRAFIGPAYCSTFTYRTGEIGAQIVNWRLTAGIDNKCQDCLGSYLTDQTVPQTVPQTSDPYDYDLAVLAHKTCGVDTTLWPANLDAVASAAPAVLQAVVLPQSNVACGAGVLNDITTDDALAAKLLAWRSLNNDTDVAEKACYDCFTNRLQGGEYSYNSWAGASAALTACGFAPNAAITLPVPEPTNFEPPGCHAFDAAINGATFAIQQTLTTPPNLFISELILIPDDVSFDPTCAQCVLAYARGTIKTKSFGAAGTCKTKYTFGETLTATTTCDYNTTRDAFNTCGAGGAADIDPWPQANPGNAYTTL